MPAAQTVLDILRPLRAEGESYAARLRRLIDDVGRLDGALAEQQVVVGKLEMDVRDLRADCDLLRRERDVARKDRESYRAWWQDTQRVVAAGVDEIGAVRAELSTTAEALAEQVQVTDAVARERSAEITAKLDAIAEAAVLREAAKRQRMAHAAELDASAAYCLLVGGLVGVVVGGVVTAILVAVL